LLSNLGDIISAEQLIYYTYCYSRPVPTYPDSYPLPTEFWTRPIYAETPSGGRFLPTG